MKKRQMVNYRSIGNKAAALALSAALAVGVCVPVQAASDSGTVGGYMCTATLTVGSSATASTTSPLVAYHHASVTFQHYYTDLNGNAQIGITTDQDNNSASVSATANGLGTNVRNIRSNSNHTVTYGSNTWKTNLVE